MSSTPKRRPKPKPNHTPASMSEFEPPQSLFPSKAELLRVVTVLAIAATVAFTCNWVSNYFNSPPKLPFCDSNITDFPGSVFDNCEPCPTNGECNQDKLECALGYIKHGRTCVEDGDISERAKKLSELVEYRLCEDYAQYQCYGTGRIWFQEDDIWNDLKTHPSVENTGLSSTSYLYTKERTLETIERLLEMQKDPNGYKEFKCPDLLADQYKPFSCLVHQWFSKHVIVIVPVCALIVALALLLWKLRRKQHLSTRVEELYLQVCDILEENALASKRVNSECEPWVVASWLRDHLLFPKERKDPVLWKKVEEVIQEDSRVDRYPKLVKGEQKVVWEWQVEGSLSSASMRRKRKASKMKPTEGIEPNSGQQQSIEVRTEGADVLKRTSTYISS